MHDRVNCRKVKQRMLQTVRFVLGTVLATIVVSSCSSTRTTVADPLRTAIAAEDELRQAHSTAVRPNQRAAVIALYTRVVEEANSSTQNRNEALFRRGRLYAEASDCAHAVGDIEKAISAGLRTASAYMVLANCHRKAGLLDRARKDIDLAIAVASNEPVLYRARATISMEQERYDEAATDLSKSIDLIKPDESSALFEMRGDAHLAAGRYGQAVDDFHAAIRVSDRDAVQIMGSASRRSAQLAPIYEKLSKAYSGLARESLRGR